MKWLTLVLVSVFGTIAHASNNPLQRLDLLRQHEGGVLQVSVICRTNSTTCQLEKTFRGKRLTELTLKRTTVDSLLQKAFHGVQKTDLRRTVSALPQETHSPLYWRIYSRWGHSEGGFSVREVASPKFSKEWEINILTLESEINSFLWQKP